METDKAVQVNTVNEGAAVNIRCTFDGTIFQNPTSKYCVIRMRTADTSVPERARAKTVYPDHLIRFTAIGHELPRTDSVDYVFEGTWTDGTYPHADKHHIKKENIGLIEVMGLAVLPSRLKGELSALKDALLSGADIHADPVLEKHADWVDELRNSYTFTERNTMDILLQETGKVFAEVLEDAGVYKCNMVGRVRFMNFVNYVNMQ